MEKKGNTILIVLLVGLAFLAGFLWNKVQTLEKKGAVANTQGTNPNAAVQQQPQQQNQTPSDFKVAKPSSDKDHWRGSKNARYVWVEYSDLECPFCKRIHPDLIKLLENKKDSLAWVYRHFPLPGHPKAQKSAEATECAAEQKGNDGFWQMTDLIFKKMPEMQLADLPTLASNLGLNKQKFSSCLDSGKYEQKVKQQANEGNQAGVQATPTGVIYDMKTDKMKTVEGALPYESLQSEMQNFIKN